MLKKHMAACLVTSALFAAPALAQTGTAPAAGTNTGAAASSALAGKFLTQASAQQWRASKLVGVDIYGPNNEKVGDVNEVLLDRNGKAEAVVIGVGGFLGIGEKDVALPWDQIQWSDRPRENRTAAVSDRAPATAPMAADRTAAGAAAPAGGPAGTGVTTGGTASAGTQATAPGMGAPTAPGGTAATTGSTATTTGTTGTMATTGTTAGTTRAAAGDMNRDYPDHGMISMTRDELKNAPSFRYASDTSRDRDNTAAGARPAGTAPAGAPATGTGAAGTAPRQ